MIPSWHKTSCQGISDNHSSNTFFFSLKLIFRKQLRKETFLQKEAPWESGLTVNLWEAGPASPPENDQVSFCQCQRKGCRALGLGGGDESLTSPNASLAFHEQVLWPPAAVPALGPSGLEASMINWGHCKCSRFWGHRSLFPFLFSSHFLHA